MTTAPILQQPDAARTDEFTHDLEQFIETYCADGRWYSRRHDSEVPFAGNDNELDQIALGSQVARWNRLPHVVRTPTGTIAEILTT
ncbi:hypothetical protein FB561_6885 [Kribbella amoyensis]|uniref:Uncharacterized protein n=1 Tax=Kribbella amoyensis TaxID=996641 RepID=A0A561B2B8_9ACTN|nr:hypothetical protein [Kribbella amoyensis]TWD73001.1 hypothetical protein FB561_6885 [Kribbella amoyensis]